MNLVGPGGLLIGNGLEHAPGEDGPDKPAPTVTPALPVLPAEPHSTNLEFSPRVSRTTPRRGVE
jgi:hypothetical protein